MKTVAIAALLTIGVVVQLAACVGVLTMRNAYDRLHFAAAATTVGPVAIAAAVVVHESLAEAGLKAVFTAAMLLTGGALLTHATGRAARIREDDGWRIRDDERAVPDR